jgi:hypothetical protein
VELKAIGQCSCNLDDGGYGGVNFVWTDEMRKYKSIYNPMKEEKQRQRMRDNNPMHNTIVAEKVGFKHRKIVCYKGKETTCQEIAEEAGV